MSQNKKESKKDSLRCGSCSFLLRDRIFENKCGEQGKLASSKACGSHIPDVFSLVKDEDDVSKLQLMSDLIHSLGNNDLQVVAALLMREKNTRKYGYSFKQKVYVRISGSANANYLSNFIVGYVLDANKENVRIIGASGKTTIVALNDKESHTVYTVERFRPLRQKMLETGHLVDPAVEDMTCVARRGGISSLDLADDAGLFENNKKVTKEKSKDDLVSLVYRMQRGIVRKAKGSEERDHDDQAEISIRH